MVAAGRLLKEEFGWANKGCGAHRLQTAVKHAISSVREVEVLLAHSRRLVAHFHRSSLATEALVKQQTAGTKTPLKLIQDCAHKMEQFVLHVGAFAGTQTTGHHSSGSRREEGRAPAHPEDKPLGAGQGGNDDLGAAGERNRYPRRGEIRDTLYSSADHQQGHQKMLHPCQFRW